MYLVIITTFDVHGYWQRITRMSDKVVFSSYNMKKKQKQTNKQKTQTNKTNKNLYG